MPSANEIMAGFKSRHKSKPKRRNIDREIKKAKVEALDLAIEAIRKKIRAEGMPESFNRAHYSAITTIEIIKAETSSQ